MDVLKVTRWVDFVASELTINELEDFQKKLAQLLEQKIQILFEKPLTTDPLKFRGIKIENSELTVRTQKSLLSMKYKTLEQLAKLSRNQLFELNQYSLTRKQMCEIIDYVAYDKTFISEEMYESLKSRQNIKESISRLTPKTK